MNFTATYDPATKSGSSNENHNVKGTIQWVSAAHALKVQVNLYDRLFLMEAPEGIDDINPNSLQILNEALIEPSVSKDTLGSKYQFERHGYFYLDPDDSTKEKLVFNQIVPLRDSWGKPKTKPIPQPETKISQKEIKEKTEKKKIQQEFQQMSPEIEARYNHYRKDLKLEHEEAFIIAKDPFLSEFFEKTIALNPNAQGIANWIVNDVLKELKEKSLSDLSFGSHQIAELVSLIDENIISNNIAKTVFCEMIKTGENPKEIVEKKNLKQIIDPIQIKTIVEKVIAANPQNLAKYKEGKTNLFGFFVGQVLKETGGKANPKLVNDLVQAKLSE